MKKNIWCLVFLSTLAQAQFKVDYPFRAVSFTQVALTDQFWLPKLEINRTVTIPHSFEQCRVTGRIKNFEQAAARKGKFNSQYVFDDSDIYKILEGAAYSLHVKYDPVLDAQCDSLIALIAKAQEPDGYLYTVRTMGDNHPWTGTGRYSLEHEHSHELYNAGHFYEAATAHFLATGKRNMLNLAIKNADHVASVFGPGKKTVAPGHEVIEIGLVKMYRVTGDKKYLDLSKFFIDARGKRSYNKKFTDKEATVWQTGAYWQDHLPVTQQTEALGHSVRAGYLYAGMIDVATLNGDADYLNAVTKIWENAFTKKTYITGGLGQAGNWEGFGPDYELSNSEAYCETCAAIASVYWNQRMYQSTGDSKYLDLVERTLYNGIISGIGLDGKTFNYENPMEYTVKAGKLSGENKRSEWFGCSCCPTNICRFMPSIPGYFYAQKGADIFVNQYASNESKIWLQDSTLVHLQQQTNYPWNGQIDLNLTVQKTVNFALNIRVPGWYSGHLFPTDLYGFLSPQSQKTLDVSINGEVQNLPIENGYVKIARSWTGQNQIKFDFKMEPKWVKANEKVKDNMGRLALERGPLVYCAEFADNTFSVAQAVIEPMAKIEENFNANILNGVMQLKSRAKVLSVAEDGFVSTSHRNISLIPYYARSNRGIGEMRIWFPSKITGLQILSD